MRAGLRGGGVRRRRLPLRLLLGVAVGGGARRANTAGRRGRGFFFYCTHIFLVY